jgi:hypothetical protein
MGLLSAIGGAIGLALGGPVGAALGSGIGSLAGGGDFKDALTSGLLGFGIGSIPGAQGFAQGAMGAAGLQGLAGGTTAASNPLAAMLGGAGGGGANPLAGLSGGSAASGAAGAGAAGAARAAATGAGAQGGLGTFLNTMAQSPLVMATLMEATQPRGSMMTPLQQRQVATGERLPDYRGTAAPDYRFGAAPRQQNFAMGGFIKGPGTGTSDSIPAKIYQNGGPVQEAMLSDGEFVMTADAVRGAGGGDRAKGAAKMYEMMSRLERRA